MPSWVAGTAEYLYIAFLLSNGCFFVLNGKVAGGGGGGRKRWRAQRWRFTGKETLVIFDSLWEISEKSAVLPTKVGQLYHCFFSSLVVVEFQRMSCWHFLSLCSFLLSFLIRISFFFFTLLCLLYTIQAPHSVGIFGILYFHRSLTHCIFLSLSPILVLSRSLSISLSLSLSLSLPSPSVSVISCVSFPTTSNMTWRSLRVWLNVVERLLSLFIPPPSLFLPFSPHPSLFFLSFFSRTEMYGLEHMVTLLLSKRWSP